MKIYEDEDIKDFKLKVTVAIAAIESMEENLTSGEEIKRLEAIKALLK